MKLLVLPLVAAFLLPTAGCAGSRWESYNWSVGPHANDKGLETRIIDFLEKPDKIHVHLAVRNLTDRDVTLHQTDDQGAVSAVVLRSGVRTVPGAVYAVRLSDDPDASSWNITEQVKIPGDLVIRAHSSEELEVDFPFTPPLASPDVAWSISTGGKWSFGDPVEVRIDVPSASGKPEAKSEAKSDTKSQTDLSRS
jgi:hypothetical protein